MNLNVALLCFAGFIPRGADFGSKQRLQLWSSRGIWLWAAGRHPAEAEAGQECEDPCVWFHHTQKAERLGECLGSRCLPFFITAFHSRRSHIECSSVNKCFEHPHMTKPKVWFLITLMCIVSDFCLPVVTVDFLRLPSVKQCPLLVEASMTS